MFDVNGAGFAIQVEPQPVIHFKSEDIGRGADLQYEVICAGAMNGTIRDQEQIMFLCSVCLHIVFNLYFFAISPAIFQYFSEVVRFYSLLKTEVNGCSRFTIENVIGFVLGDMFTEVLANIFQGRMTLYR